MTSLYVYDHLHPVIGLLGPALVQRMVEMARQHFDEGNPELHVRQMWTRIVMNDPAIRLIAAVNEQGQVVGHCLATLEEHGGKKYVYGWQMRVEAKDDTTSRIIDTVETWAEQENASTMMFVTHRSSAAWQKKYQFEMRRAVMSRPVPYKKAGDAREQRQAEGHPDDDNAV